MRKFLETCGIAIFLLATIVVAVRAWSPPEFTKNSPAAGGSFELVVTPTQQVVRQGKATTYTITVNAQDNFTEEVRLEVGEVPTGTTASFGAEVITPSQKITSTLLFPPTEVALTVQNSITTPVGDHTIVITGTGGGISRTAHITLTVEAIQWRHIFLPLMARNFEPLRASFTFTPTEAVYAMPVHFIDQSSGAPTVWEWGFGDGHAPVTATNPVHTYDSPGIYTVTLTVSDAVKSDSTSKRVLVSDMLGRNLLVNGSFENDQAWEFGSTPTPADYTAAVAYSGQRSARLGIVPPTEDTHSYSSVFQRVTIPADADKVNLSFWYWPRREKGGSVRWSLPAQNAVGMSISAWQAALRQDTQEVMILDQNKNVLEVLVALTEDAPGWLWGYFDLTKYKGHTIYVYFNVYNDGDNSDNRRAWMYVDDICLTTDVPPTARFNRSPAGIVPVSTTVHFTSTSTGASPLSPNWDFGDGSASTTTITPTHIYTAPGAYTVTLVVTNPFGSAQATERVQVGGTYESGLVINGGFETDEAWQFGSTPVLADYTDAEAHSGLRSMRLGIVPPATDRESNSSVFQPIAIPTDADQVTLSFWYWPRREGGRGLAQSRASLESAVGQSLEAWQATLTQDTQYAMVLDQYRNILEVLMAVTENEAGWREVSFDLTQYKGRTIYIYFDVYNNGYSSENRRAWMYVDDVAVTTDVPPTASFVRSPSDMVPVSATIHFTSTSSGTPPLSLEWDFGDGSAPAPTVTPTHVYTVPGVYTVTLTVTNTFGSDAASEQVRVGTITGTELLLNGGFESDEAWQFGSTPVLADYTDAEAHSGQRSMRLGIVPPADDQFSYSSAFQRVTIPADAGQVTLSFWYWPQREGDSRLSQSRTSLSQAAGQSLETWQATLSQDTQYAMVLDQYRNILEVLMAVTENEAGWREVSFDLTQYKGRTIYIYFDVYNNGYSSENRRAWMYVDDVSVLATDTPPLAERWVNIDLSEQMIYAYEDDTVVRSSLVSTGVPEYPTPTGQFYIYVKYRYDDMAGPGYYLADVPYAMYFYLGYASHGTYWHDNFGEPMSHGCVNLPTSEAEWFYNWAPLGTQVNIQE